MGKENEGKIITGDAGEGMSEGRRRGSKEEEKTVSEGHIEKYCRRDIEKEKPK